MLVFPAEAATVGGPAASPGIATGTCTEAGLTFRFDNVPGKGFGVPNALNRALGGIAIRVRRDTCNIDLVCVAGDKTPEAKALSSERCVLVRDVVVKANRRKDGFTRANIKVRRKTPGPGLEPNVVYLTFR